MTDCGACGRRMVSNGTRTSTVLHIAEGRAAHVEGRAARLRCPGCGSSALIHDPALREGFRVTEEAAAHVLLLCADVGPEAASDRFGIDRATASRLASDERDRLLSATPRPDHCRILPSIGSSVLVADAETDDPVAYFDAVEDPRLARWISDPVPPLVLPAAPLLAAVAALPWGRRIAVSAEAFAETLARTVPRCAKRFAASEFAGRAARAAQRVLSMPKRLMGPGELAELRRIAPPGSRTRSFLALRDRLLAVHDAPSLRDARARLDAWVADCAGYWARVFAPAVSFVTAFRPGILSHRIVLRVPSPRPQGPALRSVAARTLSIRAPAPSIPQPPRARPAPAPPAIRGCF